MSVREGGRTLLPLAKVVKKGEKPHNVRLGDKEKRGDAYGHRLLQLSYRPMSVYEPDVERSRGHCELRSNREGGDVSEALAAAADWEAFITSIAPS